MPTSTRAPKSARAGTVKGFTFSSRRRMGTSGLCCDGITLAGGLAGSRRGRQYNTVIYVAGRLPLRTEHLVEQLLEALRRLRAGEAATVDEEGGGGIDAERRSLALVRLDGVEGLLAVQARLELGDVHPAVLGDLRGLVLQVVLGDLALLREEA